MWMLPLVTAIQHVARFKVTASCSDLPQRQYFEDLFNENGGIFSYDKNPHLPQNYIKKQCSLGEFQKESEKEIDWVVWAWLQRDDGGGICCLLQAHYTWAKKQIKLKSLRMDGNPRKRKHVAICKQLFPASPPWGKRKFSLQKLTHAYYAFASYARREGHLYEVFLVLAKTRLI